MSGTAGESAVDAAARREASQWVLRLDRGLSTEEQEAYRRWLEADARHWQAMAELGELWKEFDRLEKFRGAAIGAPDPDLLLPRRTAGTWRRWGVALASAAALAVAAVGIWERFESRREISAEALAALAPPCEQRVLEDGSAVQLNRDSAFRVAYSDRERRVLLDRGEAFFTAAKNPARPFVVAADGVEVRAIGTAFDVRIEPGAVEVLVTEGHVKVATDGTGSGVDALQGQAVKIRFGGADSGVRVDAVDETESAERLAWRPRMLDFTAAPLEEVVQAFNEHNAIKLAVGDERLKGLKLSATFRSDNVRGFVRLMESDFAMRAERGPRGEVVLAPAK